MKLCGKLRRTVHSLLYFFAFFSIKILHIKKGNLHLLLLKTNDAGVAQLVEHNLAKVRVAGPSPVSRSENPI